MDNQLVIKIILISLFVVFGVVLVLPGQRAHDGSRSGGSSSARDARGHRGDRVPRAA